MLAEALPFIVILLIPLSVHAGAFSALTNLFISNEVVTATSSEEVINYSAQSTPLLSARINPDPQAVGGGDVSVDEGALVTNGPIDHDKIAASANNNGEISVYVVREGDSLSQIAEMYGVTSNTIVWANDLTGSIQPGQTLVILPIAGVRHEVLKGETLASIVKKYEADLDEVLRYNNLTSSDSITVGMELMIPGGSLHTATEKVVATAAPTKTTGGGATGSGWLSNPAPGSIKTQGIHGYNGVDLGGKLGSAIRAAAAGQVIVAKASGWNGGYGEYVVIKHSNGAQTLYGHLSSVNVSVGDWVAQGQVIGGMGSTGKSTGTHLHFEVRGGKNPF